MYLFARLCKRPLIATVLLLLGKRFTGNKSTCSEARIARTKPFQAPLVDPCRNIKNIRAPSTAKPDPPEPLFSRNRKSTWQVSYRSRAIISADSSTRVSARSHRANPKVPKRYKAPPPQSLSHSASRTLCQRPLVHSAKPSPPPSPAFSATTTTP